MSTDVVKLLALVLLPALAIPFLHLEGMILFMLVLLYFLMILFFFRPFEALLVLIIVRPLLDTFTDKTILLIGPIPINISAILALIVISCAGILALKNIEEIKKLPLGKPWLILLAIAACSILFSINAFTSLTEIARIMSSFSLFVIGYLLINSKEKFLKFLSAIVLSSVIPGIFAYYQFFTQTGLTVPFEGIYNRIYGTFAHPNSLAFFSVLILSVLIFLMVAKDQKNKSKNNLIILAAFFNLILLALTFTRGAWLALFLVIAIIGIVQYRVLLYVFIAILLLSYLAFEPMKSRINETISLNPTGSVAWRISLWKQSALYSLEKPLLGHGIGTASEVILANSGKSGNSTDPHNDYLKFALETGLLGLSAFLFLFLSTIHSLAKRYGNFPKKYFGDKKILVLTLLSLALSLFVTSFADNLLRNTVLQWTYWSLLGAYFGTYSENKKAS